MTSRAVQANVFGVALFQGQLEFTAKCYLVSCTDRWNGTRGKSFRAHVRMPLGRQLSGSEAPHTQGRTGTPHATWKPAPLLPSVSWLHCLPGEPWRPLLWILPLETELGHFLPLQLALPSPAYMPLLVAVSIPSPFLNMMLLTRAPNRPHCIDSTPGGREIFLFHSITAAIQHYSFINWWTFELV